MNSLERVMTTLSHKEPDKVPVFFLLTIQGALQLHLDFPTYFSSGENVAKGQLALQKKYGHDCLYPFFYAAKEYEAFGGKIIFNPNGPPTAGDPVFSTVEELLSCELPNVESKIFQPIYQAQKILYEKKGKEFPIVNGVIAPLSLCVMLLGFEQWIECIVNSPEKAKEIVDYLTEYSIDLANSLLDHKATALAYSNPLASSQLLRIEEYKTISLKGCKRFFSSIKGSAVYAFAGARCEKLLPILVNELKVSGVSVSAFDNLQQIKNDWGSRVNLLGNLNNIAMINWTLQQAEDETKRCITTAKTGGGYILCDHQGDYPIEVKPEILLKIIETRDNYEYY